MNEASRLYVEQHIQALMPQFVRHFVASLSSSSDPIKIARLLGLQVIFAQTSHNCGRLFKLNGNWAIILPQNAPYRRQRFSCAHELGHYALYQDSSSTLKALCEVIPGYYDVYEIEERFCTQFAKELLMPRDSIVNALTNTNQLSLTVFWKWLQVYMCSLQATAIRVTDVSDRYAFVVARMANSGPRSGSLTVDWSAAPAGVHVPVRKVIPLTSVIGQAYMKQHSVSGVEDDPFGGRLRGSYTMEAKPLRGGNSVFAVIHLRSCVNGAVQLQLPI